MTDVRPVHGVAEHPEDQLGFLLDEVDAGRRCALVTIVDIVERASRNIGTQMVVLDDGRYAGSVSSGCIDGSVATMALDALNTREARRVRLGAGSSFIDLKLPCGGGVDLLIQPDPQISTLRGAVEALHDRRPAALTLDEFTVNYHPKPRLILVGRGSELTVFTRLGVSSGYDVHAFSPDEIDVDTCRVFGAFALRLASSSESPSLQADAWTAIVTLFHDHDWEPAVLRSALATEAFYIGALGSARTHEQRLATLAELGVADGERIRGPIGLVPSMRNATMLAISTLAEIVEHFNRQHPTPVAKPSQA
ncbi:MAG: XdhC family protein [Pseudomonadota bacterium]